MSWKLPSSCPVCSAMGYVFPDHGYPEIYTRCEFNCGTRGMKQNEEAGGNKHTRRLWITSVCVRRYTDSLAEQKQQLKEAA